MNTTDIITQLKPVFEKVAEKIGSGAEFGWTVVLRQQYVEAWENLLFAIVGLLAIKFVFIPWVKKLTLEDSHKRWDGGGWVAFTFTIIPTIIFILSCLDTTITHFINPQFYALQFFMGLVR